MVDAARTFKPSQSAIQSSFNARRDALNNPRDQASLDILKNGLLRPLKSGNPLTSAHLNRLAQQADRYSPEVKQAFRALLGELQLLAGLTDETTNRSVRQGAAGVRDVGAGQIKSTTFQTQRLIQQGREGLAVGATGLKKAGQPGDLDALREALGAVDHQLKQGEISVSGEVMDALGDRLTDTMSTLAVGLYRDPKFSQLLSKFASKPSLTAVKELAAGAGETLSATMGLKLVNKELLSEVGQLIPSFASQTAKTVGTAMAKEGGEKAMEAAAKKVGQAVVQEGAEAVVKEGAKVAAKEGTKRGLMGVLSAVPLANVIPMLFTGGELLAGMVKLGSSDLKDTEKTATKAMLGKGLGVFALQLGALAFPPLGLVAAGADVTGSVAIAAWEAKASGKGADDAKQATRAAMDRHGAKDTQMTEAIASGGDLSGHALDAIVGSLRSLGSDERADQAERLAQELKALKDSPDEAEAGLLHSKVGQFLLGAVLPELQSQTKKLQKSDPESSAAWSSISQGLEQMSMATYRLREGESGAPEENGQMMKGLFKGIMKVLLGAKDLTATPDAA